jgi:hypothetical protein
MATNITFHPGGQQLPLELASSFSPPLPSLPLTLLLVRTAVSTEERAELLGQQGATIWLTGLSASGKVSILNLEQQSRLGRGR